MDNKTLYTIIVHSENIAGILNQITAVFTRRQINIESLNVSASSIKGVHKYTITCWTTHDIVEKVVKQIEKKMDVIQTHYFSDDEIFLREIAMYKVSTPEFQANPEASKVIRRYSAHIVEVNPVFSIVEMTGMSDDITSPYQELCFQTLDKRGNVIAHARPLAHGKDWIHSHNVGAVPAGSTATSRHSA